MKISDAPTLKKTDKQLMKILAWGGAVKHIVKELAQATQIIFIPECCHESPHERRHTQRDETCSYSIHRMFPLLEAIPEVMP